MSTNKMWGGRFEAGPAAIMEEINASIDFDRHLYRQDIAASKAHADMLAKQGIISADDAKKIAHGLDTILSEIESGKFKFKRALEDIHMNVESRLAELIGPAAGEAVVFGRFEASAPNERWVGDALHGPRVGGRKTYLFAFLDDQARLAVGYRFGFAEDTVRLAAALEPALASRGVPASCYVDNGSAYVDAWLLRACGKLGIRLIHSTPHRPQGRGKIERFFRTVRDQFLVEVTDTSAADLAERELTPAAGLLELNGLFTAWVESVYHHQVHSETGQSPLQRWNDGWQAAGHGPVMPAAAALTEAFLWSTLRTVTKTATVSLHGNTYQVEPALAGRKVELVFSPFNLEQIEVRHGGRCYGPAVPHLITRHAHPKARPETPEPPPAPATGIAYLQLVADAHHQQVAADERIGYRALYSTGSDQRPEQIPGQLSIDDCLADEHSGGQEEEAGR